MRFEHKVYDYDEFTGRQLNVVETIVIETEAVTLTEIIDAFERFLKACDYHFDGKLDFVGEDE